MKNIMQYESKVWATADFLRAVGIPGGDYPKYMMPIFAMMMVESRILKLHKDKSLDKKKHSYNDEIVKGMTLSKVCEDVKGFDKRLKAYLDAYDDETKKLLGVVVTKGQKYLNVKEILEDLDGKQIIYDYLKKWSEISLVDFNNSEITTLEEHIKRKWADLSSSTANAEQYTPEDIIATIARLLKDKIEPSKYDKKKPFRLYDMTCGGGNMLYGIGDQLSEKFPKMPLELYGQDYSSHLYALSKIESMFRDNAHIGYGNTLTDDQFEDIFMSALVANPPYGSAWNIKGSNYEEKIFGNKKKYPHTPGTGDGQLLFMEHGAFKLDFQQALGYIVLNGSPLYSGDAGSGESDIRKYLLDNDWVEAIIQLPKDEFFNTNITTYLWCLNKHKDKNRKDKVLLVNASELGTPLKKSKGKKSQELGKEAIDTIASLIKDFKDTDLSKVYEKVKFYYNKQVFKVNGEKIVDSIAHSFDPKEAKKLLDSHIEKWYSGKQVLIDKSQTGVTINFNKIFYRLDENLNLKKISDKIKKVSKEIKDLEDKLWE